MLLSFSFSLCLKAEESTDYQRNAAYSRTPFNRTEKQCCFGIQDSWRLVAALLIHTNLGRNVNSPCMFFLWNWVTYLLSFKRVPQQINHIPQTTSLDLNQRQLQKDDFIVVVLITLDEILYLWHALKINLYSIS